MIQEGNKLIPAEGKILTKDGIYSTEVYLGIYDSADNWQEVDIEEAEELTDEEALQIITGQDEAK